MINLWSGLHGDGLGSGFHDIKGVRMLTFVDKVSPVVRGLLTDKPLSLAVVSGIRDNMEGRDYSPNRSTHSIH